MADKVYLTDKDSLDALVGEMPPAERAEYKSYKSLALESAFPGRRMVVYTLRGGVPADIEVFQFGEICVPLKDPPTIRVFYKRREALFGPVPERLADRDVFLSVPQNFVFRWGGQLIDGVLQFRAQYAVLIKTKSAESRAVEGHTYCVTLKRFTERYPELSDEVRF